MTRARAVLGAAHPLALALSLGACRVETGAGAGLATGFSSSGAARADLAWEGALAADFAPGAERGPVLGATVDLRSTLASGARYAFGLRGGYAWNTPLRFQPAPGVELLGAAGVPVRSGVPFAGYSFYAGASVAFVWWLGPPHEGAARNRSLWYLHATPQLVLFARARAYVDDPGSELARAVLLDATAGVALRLRFVSDLL